MRSIAFFLPKHSSTSARTTSSAPDMNALRNLMDDLRSKIASGIALAAEIDGKAMLVLAVSKDLHGRFTAPA